MAYSAEEKAMAIAIMQRFGGMTQEALETVTQALGRKVSTSTLHGWLPKTKSEIAFEKPKIEKTSNQPTPEMIQAADQKLDDMFENIARRYLVHANKDDIIEATKGKDAVITAATAVDKMRLLRGLPTEIVNLIPSLQQLYDLLIAQGREPSSVFNAMIAKLHAERNKSG